MIMMREFVSAQDITRIARTSAYHNSTIRDTREETMSEVAARRESAARYFLPTIVLALAGTAAAPLSNAETPSMGLAVTAGSTGIGLDYGIGLGRSFSVRVGYSGLHYDHSVDSSDVDYDGTFKLSMPKALLDWYVFKGGFHLTAGVVGNGTRIDVTGRPVAGVYTINGTQYSSSDAGSLAGRLKFGNSLSPYVGLGWGNMVGTHSHLHFLVDIGAIYGGTPSVSLTATCGPAAPSGSPVCTQLQSDVQAERLKLQNDVTVVRWYPVLDLGLAYRF